MSEQQFTIPTIPRDPYQQDNHLPIGDEIISYVSDRPIEYVKWQGIMVYIQGATYPKKGFPMPESIGAINIIKHVIKDSINYPAQLLISFLLNKNKLLISFNSLFDKVFAPYTLKNEYMCHASFMFQQFLSTILIQLHIPKQLAETTSHNIAQIVEYDDAYRYRLQDLATETVLKDMYKNPRKEVKRLLCILQKRDNKRVAKDITKIVNVLLILLLIPRIRKALIIASPHFKEMQYDESDKYWAYLKDGEYEFGGLPYEERTSGWQIPQAYKIKM